MRAIFSRCSAWAALPLALAALACGDDEKLGSVMLAISTDMYIDKDVDRVDVVIQPENGPMQSQPFNLFPALDGKFLPGTFSIIEGSTPGEFVRVRIIARKQNTARVVREAALRVPKKRTALLSMPIQWLCDGHVREDGQLSRSSCPDEETCLAGTCLPDTIDESTLPDYVASDVFGGGNATGGGDCFDTMECFEVNTAPALNLDTCVLDAEVSDDLNVAIWLPAGSDGHCSNAECWVPLDSARLTGWAAAEDGSGVQLPPAVCEHVRSGGASVRVSHACASKTVGVPTCGQWTLVGTQPGDEEPPLDGAPLVVTNLTLAEELETATNRLARTVATACAEITGQSPPDEPTIPELSSLCDAAQSRIADYAPLDWYHVTTRCWPDATRQLACELACNESCDPGSVVERCEPAQIAGGCSDSCDSRECLGSDRRGTGCAGACDGTCKGSCAGTCIGQCTGNCDATGADGAYCVGYCDAMCSGLCQGRCEGTCEGSCEGDPNLPVPECAAGTQCRGGCAGDYTSPVCHSPLTSSPCSLSDDCAADCVSIGNLGVACEPATAWFMPRTGLDETLRQALEQALAELVTVRDVEAPAVAEQAQRIADELQGTAATSGDPLRTAQAAVRVRAAGAMLEAITNSTGSVVDAVGEPRDTPGPAIPSADCTATVGSGRDGLIDDFEDNNSQISVRDGRNGFWHIVRDGSADAQISPDEPPLPESNGLNSSRGAMHVTGSGFTDWGAGLSMELRSTVLPFDASAYQGIRFWARGEPSLRLVLLQQNLATGDRCTTCPQSSSECGIFYGTQIALTSDWT
ncbi:MAG TPA: hypothetical protein VMG12_01260, partial [Polyangiaceae bacterium]|nr:hypothetical protein [Polyangiaceae bacterium]